MTDIELFDCTTIDQITWPNTPDGLYAKRYLEPFLRNHSAHFIRNVDTKLYILFVDNHVLPITVNESEYENSYVCSPYTHYVSYAKQELTMLQSPAIERLLSIVLAGVGYLLKSAKANKVVHVNNWLLSTNLYPHLSKQQITDIVHFLTKQFPDHYIVFRSLTEELNTLAIAISQQLGSKLIPSRQIYMLKPSDPHSTNAKARWLVKRDYRLLAKHGYEVVNHTQLTQEDIPRILYLYNALYLEKYSYYNPQFTEQFLKLVLDERILELYALKKDGQIDAVLGFFCRSGVMTTPLFGYDTSAPKQLGLYRMLSSVLLSIAENNGHLLHESSGAAEFKRNRGAVSAIEYSAVYDKHLNWQRKICWSLLGAILNRIGVPLLKKNKL